MWQSGHTRSRRSLDYLSWVRSLFSSSLRLHSRPRPFSGGKAESLHHKAGEITVQEASDQLADDKSVRALLQTHRMKRPIALLIDDRYAMFPYDISAKPDCMYVVLGFYHIAHAWGKPPS